MIGVPPFVIEKRWKFCSHLVLLLFHFIQRFKGAVPLLRKMPITTSAEHERYGADAVHYKIENGKNVIVLGEAKAYTSEYQFSSAFKKAIDSILDTYKKFRGELGLYLHEDFLDKDSISPWKVANTRKANFRASN